MTLLRFALWVILSRRSIPQTIMSWVPFAHQLFPQFFSLLFAFHYEQQEKPKPPLQHLACESRLNIQVDRLQVLSSTQRRTSQPGSWHSIKGSPLLQRRAESRARLTLSAEKRSHSLGFDASFSQAWGKPSGGRETREGQEGAFLGGKSLGLPAPHWSGTGMSQGQGSLFAHGHPREPGSG